MRKKIDGFFRFGITAILNVCALAMIGSVQAQSVTDGSTPSGIAPGSPAGSYALSDFDNVNLFNGHLDVRLKLLNLAGRGGADMAAGVSLNPEPWVVKGTGVTHDWWSLKPGYGPGVMQVRRIGVAFSGVGQTCSQDSLFHYRWTRTAVTFKASDGTEFELWDKLSGGPWKDAGSNYCSTGFSRGTEFVTADGNSATFVSDSVITDRNRFFTNTEQILFPTGNLILKNGTRYRIVNGLVDSIRDRNGNLMTFTYGLNSSDPLTYRKVLTITDSLKRVVSFQYTANSDVISFKGFNGSARTITINRTSLSNALRADFVSLGVKKPSELFPGITPVVNEQVYNPSVIASITLPNNRTYAVRYNQYAEVARVVLPTGGAIEYDMVPGSGLVADEPNGQIVYQILRRVWKRRVYTNETDTLPVQLMTYTASGPFGDLNVTVDQLNPQNGDQLLTREKHYFHGNPVESLFRQPPSEGSWGEGREYRTETFSVVNGVVGNVLRKVENLWEPGVLIAPGGRLCKARVKETTVTWLDTNQVSKQVFGYDDTAPFNNQNNVKEYDFGVGAPGALLRETRTTYVNSTNYTASNVNLVGLASQVSVFDGNGIERARSSFEYDNYTLDGPNCLQSFHCALAPRSNISGFDATFGTSYTTRGNVTASTEFLLSNGVVTGSISRYSHYDIAGNIVRAIDPRSTPSNIIATTIEYDDRFGTPTGEARANSAPTELAGQSAFAFPSRTINPLGHESFTQRDYYIGQAVDAEDANGIVSSSYFNDLLDRATQVISAVNGDSSVISQTTFAYDDALRLITTTSDQVLYGDNILKTQLVYDGLGRTVETRQYEGGSNFISVETQYDALGRGHKVSNPYRQWQSEAVVWTTTAFDALGRVTSVTTPDSAVVVTSYDGNTVTVTDQAGKRRKSVTDALGRLTAVYEDPDVPGGPAELNYQTTYTYDVLDNLVKVVQGSQQRFFMYDSLKRLIRTRNPEQGTLGSLSLSDPLTGNSAWSTGYQYDSNNNLIERTDVRGVVSTYQYDALNRNTTINYSDTTINPDVKRFYDGAANGKGRFWYFYSGGDYSTGPNVDHTSVDSYDALGRPLVQRQLFKLNNVWSPTYQTSRAYNRTGAVKSQIYPSSRSVTYNYDSAGRLADKDAANLAFTGTLGDNTPRTYSRGISYASSGQLRKEQFGTNTPVYQNRHYNVRRQLCDVRASHDGNNEWGGELGALVNYYSTAWAHCGSGTDNNSNVLMTQTIINSVYFEDRYTYDALNRLTAVSEFLNGSTPTGSQQYSYDRWGNRNIIPGSPGLGFNTSFEKEDATNRLYAPGDLALAEGARRIRYDAAGNQTKDTYTGYGDAVFDAENNITSIQDKLGGWSYYTYNADGKRTRRKINNQETWHIYGMDGELLADYAAAAAAASPQKEYGYRNGELLVTTGPVDTVWSDDAVPAGAAIAGDAEGWNWVSSGPGPFSGGTAHQSNIVAGLHQHYFYGATATLSVSAGDKLVAYVYLDPNNMPSQIMLQWAEGGSWEHRAYWGANNLPWGVNGTNSRRYMGPLPAAGSWVRLEVPASLVGLEGYTLHGMAFSMWGGRATWDRAGKTSAAAVGSSIQWLVSDHLGTPRMVFDQTGTLANVKRHDYLPFGEELFAGTGGRTVAQGYSAADGVRQQFTSKERDIETGLDYFGARYYSSTQGRFVSVDPLDPVLGKQGANYNEEAQREFRAYLAQPQRWNRYTYCLNNPLRHVDPDGFETLTVNLNIVFDAAAGYTEEEKKKFRDSYVAQLQKDFAHADIQFNVTYTEGSASDTNNSKRQITSGAVDGALNAFVTRGSVGPSPEVTRYDTGRIFISTGANMSDQNPGNLTHGVIHALGIAGGVNGYTSPDNKGHDRWQILGDELWNKVFGNSAESATEAVHTHLRILSSGGYRPLGVIGYGQAPAPTFKTEINYLREGARRYLKK